MILRRTRAIASLGVCLLLTAPGSPGAPGRPETYDDFEVVVAASALSKMMETNQQLYLPPGTHEIDNPLIIDRDAPIYLHGAGRGTRLVAKNPNLPLIVIERAPLVSISNLTLHPASESKVIEARAILAKNEAPVILELQDCTVNEAALEIDAPGTFRLQATSFFPKGRVRTPILLDHAGASLTMVGGNISNGKNAAAHGSSDAYHIWQKHGRLRVYGTGVQAAHGRADFRIESASRNGAHLIANVRSEGNNGSNKGSHRSTLVEVPKTEEAVDLVVESSAGAWGRLGRGAGRIVDYNAAGTLWLFGNNSFTGAKSLAEGSAPRARIIAFGNVVHETDALLPIAAPVKVAIGNLEYRESWLGNSIEKTRLIPDVGSIEMAREAISALPDLDPPEPLVRPRLTTALPGMKSVKEFGAIGDGQHDDTRSLQAALDADCGKRSGKVLFFPSGTYRVTDRLRFNHRDAKCRKHSSGGWIAGAGSDTTAIVRSGPDAGGVFISQGIAQMTIQGLMVKTTAFVPEHPDAHGEAAFAIENDERVGPASQGVAFYDMIFDGGRQALGIGLASPTQCSENLIVDATFRNAHIGLAVGSYNALANLVYRGAFSNNDIAMGHDEASLSGGTWSTLGATLRGTHQRDLSLRNSASGVWLLHGLDSDSRSVLRMGGVSGAIFPLVFENSRWTSPALDAVGFDFKAAGGALFLRSTISKLTADLDAKPASYAISLDSAIGSFDSTRVGERGRVWTSTQRGD